MRMTPRTFLLCSMSFSLATFWFGYGLRREVAKVSIARSSVAIGDYSYLVSFSSDTLGKTSFPRDDTYANRTMTLPTMKDQDAVSFEHEEIHACMHNHPHHFITAEELKNHLEKQTYTEEEVATILAPCMLGVSNEEAGKFR